MTHAPLACEPGRFYQFYDFLVAGGAGAAFGAPFWRAQSWVGHLPAARLRPRRSLGLWRRTLLPAMPGCSGLARTLRMIFPSLISKAFELAEHLGIIGVFGDILGDVLLAKVGHECLGRLLAVDLELHRCERSARHRRAMP